MRLPNTCSCLCAAFTDQYYVLRVDRVVLEAALKIRWTRGTVIPVLPVLR